MATCIGMEPLCVKVVQLKSYRYPKALKLDLLVAMNKKAYGGYHMSLKPEEMLMLTLLL